MFFLSSFSLDLPCQLYVFWHYGYSFRMNSTQVRILQQSHQIGFCRLLQSQYCTTLKSQIWVMCLCYFSHQSLKWHSPYEKVGRPLIPPYFSQCYSSRSVSSGSHLLLAHTHLCSWCLPRSSYCRMTGQPFQVSWLWYVWFIISYHVSCKLIYQMIMFLGICFHIQLCPPEVYTSCS